MKLIKSLFLSLLLVSTLSARQEVDVNFSNLAINDFIKLIAKITSKNILVNYKVNGTVDLVSSAPIYDDELMGILISVLESKGFTLVRNGSVYEVVRSTEAAKHNVNVVTPGKYAWGSLMVTQAITLENENVDIVAAKVRYLISKTAKLMTMKESNTLLLTDYQKNIQTIKKVIKGLENAKEIDIKVVHVQHAELKKLHTQVNEIVKSLFNAKVASQIIKVLINTDVNGLVLVGRADHIVKVEALIAELDKEVDYNEVVQIISLKNSDAKGVLTTLNEIVSKQTFPDPTLKPNISANEEINSVILVGNPTIIKGLRRIIDELDKEKYQVYVQARIVEINNNDAETMGLQYGVGAIDTASGLYAFSGNFGASGLTTAAGTGVLAAITGGASQAFALNAALDFMQSTGVSKTVSNPSILCVNNQESSIYVGKTVSIQTGSAVSTGAVQSNSFKREDIGLELKIKPRVSSVDKVTLNVDVKLENIVGIDQNSGQPITTKQTVITEAILRHGESIIVGGLVKTYDKEDVAEVPFLSAIPFLGPLLFSHVDIQEQKDNLLVILTPYVIDKSEKLSSLQKQLGELAKFQKEFNEEAFKKIEEMNQDALPKKEEDK